jgi:ABC-type polysaccharide/polyol phosphate export permease
MIAFPLPTVPPPARPRRAGAHPAGLVWTLVRTDFKVRYHGTVAGFLWALLKPFTMFVVLLGAFSFVFASDPNYKINLIVGLFLWDFFAEATKVGLISLYAKAYLLTKARFPSWILVVASTSNAVITLGVFSMVIVCFLALSGRPPSLGALGWFVLYLMQYFLMVVGFSLATSVLFLRYRDLNQVWEVVSQAGFFVAPIIYPLGILPERFHFYLYLWPPTAVIQFSRMVLVDGVVPSARAHLFLLGVTAVMLAAGVLIFKRHAPRAAEYL